MIDTLRYNYEIWDLAIHDPIDPIELSTFDRYDERFKGSNSIFAVTFHRDTSR